MSGVNGSDTTEGKIHFLSSPCAYDPPPNQVTVKETHMSWVFLTESRVYKLKKPLREAHIDFRSLAAREANCRDEVRLNRRLAPEVYLGVVPLIRNSDGSLELGESAAEGTVIDWLVEMQRLPEGRMLDQLLANSKADRQQIVGIAELLAGFYAARDRISMTPADYVQQFRREQAISAGYLTAERFALPGGQRDTVLTRVDRMLDGFTPLAERVRAGCIVDGHGDLRPEHVCLTDPPVIIDCLEFSGDLRRIDPYDEIAFLALECTLLGAPWIGRLLLDRLAQTLGSIPGEVLEFYWAYRACLRARQALAHLDHPRPRTPEKWQPLARRYMELAEAGLGRSLQEIGDGTVAKDAANRFGD